MRVLIIDDDLVDRMAMVRAMQQATAPITLVEADTAETGLNLARQSSFDVVLLDYGLPDRDGIEVLKELQHLAGGSMTVVMLSHQDDLELAQQAISAGAQDFLLKEEVNTRRLLRTVYQAQQRHALKEELRESHERLRILAERDSLTGLSNRFDFERGLRLAVARAQRDTRGLALLLLDIDRFKDVNDTYGHDVGDKLLVEVARRLVLVIRNGDELARLGGDEFVVLLQDVLLVEHPILLANRITEAFSDPFVFGPICINMSTSIGIASYGKDTDNAVALMKCADIALYRAKQGGRNRCHFYSEQLHLEVQARAELEHNLRTALEQDQFKVYYQAQINAHDDSLVGMEALIRWQHPVRGLLSPAHFLAQTEELGMMPAVGQWVLRTACKQLRTWQASIPPHRCPPTVSVNLSLDQLQEKNLVELIDSALAESGLAADCLELEITESALIKDPEGIVDVLKTIASRGIRLALDDFGTGFSSFEHLRLFPIHSLKIDQRFVGGIGNSEAEDRLLRAMVSFGKTLGLTVIAEGVETADQATICREIGCDFLQGYYFSRPVSAEDFEAAFLHPGM